MSKFALSQRSYFRLWKVNPKIVRILEEAIEVTPFDFGVAYMGGFRTAEEQRQLFIEGVSKADGEIHISRHQTGDAVDLIIFAGGFPIPLDEPDYVHMQCAVAGCVLTVAKRLNIPLRWGGNWGKEDIREVEFFDPYHFEL